MFQKKNSKSIAFMLVVAMESEAETTIFKYQMWSVPIYIL